jgi:endonuclease-3
MGSSEKEKDLRKRALEIARLLAAEYPDARCLLDYKNPFQLLIATILAAQCTDERVNAVTPKLFERFPDPPAMAAAEIEEIEELVRSTGFFHNKAKSIKGAAAALARDHKREFPRAMEDLIRLPGVGRKTANVVLGNCFSVPSIIVDTHVKRVAGRLGLAARDDPDGMELELRDLLPQEEWTGFSLSVTFHGRRCCAARKPACPRCRIERLCPWTEKTV